MFHNDKDIHELDEMSWDVLKDPVLISAIMLKVLPDQCYKQNTVWLVSAKCCNPVEPINNRKRSEATRPDHMPAFHKLHYAH